jgi:phage terminase large subunit
MSQAEIYLPPKLIPLFLGKADVRAACGGRGSGKTRSFAKMSAARGYQDAMAGKNGIILCGRQFQNSLDDSSFGEVKEAILSEEWLADFYDVGDRYIRTRDRQIDYTFAGLDRNINSIKGKSRILLAWIDEAEPVTETAWSTLIPTVREDGSETWVTWNPEKKSSPVESRFRYSSDPLIRCVDINWRDNPKFPEKLERQRVRDLEERPNDYDHIWEGGYKSYVMGAYFAGELAKAKEQKRIGRVSPDPYLPVMLFVDIGGTGQKSDAFSMWACQFVGKEIRVLNYYEAQGQPIGEHLAWMRKNGYDPGKVRIWLPHDGSTNDKVYDISYESAFKKIGYDVKVLVNQGSGAASMRIEAVRRWFPSCWFNEDTTQSGRDALGWYHEKWDDKRNIGLGPSHDWASHAADAFGLMATVVGKMTEEKRPEPTNFQTFGVTVSGMGG